MNGDAATKHTNSDMDIITEAALHKRQVVWILSGIEIPAETEELIGKLGMNFQFAPKKIPSIRNNPIYRISLPKN